MSGEHPGRAEDVLRAALAEQVELAAELIMERDGVTRPEAEYRARASSLKERIAEHGGRIPPWVPDDEPWDGWYARALREIRGDPA